MTYIELLAPAKDLPTGREAVLHGADAVYIGAPRFGARAAAVNSVEDIRQLCNFAHLYGVRIYVTLNTILFDEELEEARLLALQLQDAGVDALIVQDLALLSMDLQIPLHASTQMDNRDAKKVQWLWQQGFRQAVLARELTLEEIRAVHDAVPQMALEAFVHGATCVSYNGQCYASQYCFGRSANRGECAQFCRLPFDLLDDEGNELMHQRYLLSLHDMNRSDELEDMLDAGVVSLKIEGRLKDTGYVKNVTAYYRQRLDEIMKRRPMDYGRRSVGVSQFAFTPNVERSFNRGFSNYFLHGRTANMVQLSTPKSMGEHVGQVKEVRRNCFTVRGVASFSNGDGLCFLNERGQLQGFRVNRVEGNCLYPKEMPRGLQPRTTLYRNFDQDFEQQLSRPTATRKIAVSWELKREEQQDVPTGFTLTLTCQDGLRVSRIFTLELQAARSPQQEAVRRQLERLGDSIYEMTDALIDIPFDSSSDCFIPASILASWRRELVEAMDVQRREAHLRHSHQEASETPRVDRLAKDPISLDDAFRGKFGTKGQLTYLANVANQEARHFFQQQGVGQIDDALEVNAAKADVLMTTRYCIRHELGMCPKVHGAKPQNLSLRSNDGRTFSLHFDCRNCQMQVRLITKE